MKNERLYNAQDELSMMRQNHAPSRVHDHQGHASVVSTQKGVGDAVNASGWTTGHKKNRYTLRASIGEGP